MCKMNTSHQSLLWSIVLTFVYRFDHESPSFPPHFRTYAIMAPHEDRKRAGAPHFGVPDGGLHIGRSANLRAPPWSETDMLPNGIGSAIELNFALSILTILPIQVAALPKLIP